jgi:predicted transposase YbfD/YdcC
LKIIEEYGRLARRVRRQKPSPGGDGRFERRRCYICEDLSWLEGREKWPNLQGIGVIFCETEENGKKSKQALCFIYSCKGMTAMQIPEAKCSHRGIEGRLHWLLDMQFREAESRVRADNSAENPNVLRRWDCNHLKAQSSLKGSFSDKQFKCLLNEASPDKVIVSALCS